MSTKNSTINCPNCNAEIDVNEILYHQVDEQLKKQYEDTLEKEKKRYQNQLSTLEKEREALSLEKEKQQDIIKHQVNSELKEREAVLKRQLKKESEAEQLDAIALLREELAEKSTKIKELNKATITIEKLTREKDELEESIKAASEKELSIKINQEKERIRKEEFEKNELKFKELQKQLEDQKTLTEEMRRKQDQGSMQIQGEVQELAIEEWLAEKFPLDTIEEIKKGERGADCLQIVNTRLHQNCGTIYYESKRTKNFQANWIEKFKADIRERNANIGVLVTDALPADMSRLGLKDGIWICTFSEFKGLCSVLRESIIQVNTAIATQENKGDKMGMLYDFQFHCLL